jgi:hypothetical protein
MTDPNKDPERALGALFDRTASGVDDDSRQRLLRRTAEIGNAARPAPRTRFVWVPAFAAAAAVAYLAVPHRHVETPVAARASASAPAIATLPAASPAVTPEPVAEETEDDPLTTVLAGDPSDLEPLDLGPLMGRDVRTNEDVGHGGSRHLNSLGDQPVQRSPQ